MSKLTILVNLGTPDQPFEKEVRTYLREFLSDKYVIRLPRIFWLTLLNLVIPVSYTHLTLPTIPQV